MILYLALLVQSDVDPLIEQLRSDGIEARSEAVRKLVEMGEPACEKLLPHMGDRDPEVAARVREVIIRIGAPGPLIDFIRGTDGTLAVWAADAFHNLHRPFPGERWAEGVEEALSRSPRRPVTVDALRQDLTNMGVPVLTWPPDLRIESKELAGTYQEILDQLPVSYTISEGGVLLHPRSEDVRARPLCRVMIESMDTRLAVLFADLCTEPLDRALVARVGKDGFWKHAPDILIYRAVKGGAPTLTDAAAAAMAERLLDPSWTRRAIAAQALIAVASLPAPLLRHEDPIVRYLAACIAERARIHHPNLYGLMRDRHRDLRTRALYAALASGKPEQMEFDAILYAAATIPDNADAIAQLRKMGDVEALGVAAVQTLRTPHKKIGFAILDVFQQEKILLEICSAAEGETEEWAQEEYLHLLEGAYGNEKAQRAAQKALLVYMALKSERVGREAAAILIRQRRDEVRDGIATLLAHELLAVRTRAAEALYGWAMRHYSQYDAENDAVAKILEDRIEKDADLADLLKSYASRLRGRGAKPGIVPMTGGGGGGRYGGRRSLVKRGDGYRESKWIAWIPWVDVTIPRPDLQAD